MAYSFSCGESVSKVDVKIRIFEELPLQTNRFTLLSSDGNVLAYKVLTPIVAKFSYDTGFPAAKASDSDADGLSDEEESAYRTDVRNSDSDGDFYSDGEEVSWGWNPLSKELSPGQKYREEPIPVPAELPNFSGVGQSPSGTGGLGSDTGASPRAVGKYQAPVTLLDSSVYGADFFRKVL